MEIELEDISPQVPSIQVPSIQVTGADGGGDHHMPTHLATSTSLKTPLAFHPKPKHRPNTNLSEDQLRKLEAHKLKHQLHLNPSHAIEIPSDAAHIHDDGTSSFLTDRYLQIPMSSRKALMTPERVTADEPFKGNLRTPRRALVKNPTYDSEQTPIPSPRPTHPSYMEFKKSLAASDVPSEPVPVVTPTDRPHHHKAPLFKAFLYSDTQGIDPHPEEVKKHKDKKASDGQKSSRTGRGHSEKIMIGDALETFNEGFHVPIKTSILDDKTNRPKNIVKITAALVIFICVVGCALLLSFGFLQFYFGNAYYCQPKTFIDALSIDFTNNTCDFCPGGNTDIQTLVTVSKICNPLWSPGYRVIAIAQSASPRISRSAGAYVAGISNVTKPLPRNVSEDVTFPVCVGQGGTVLLIVCLTRVGAADKIQRGDAINVQAGLDDLCSAVGVFPHTPCGGIEWGISPIALQNFTNTLVRYPLSCDNFTYQTYNYSSVEGTNCFVQETMRRSDFKLIELIFGGIFYVFIFLSNIDMMMRLQPILFKGFSHRPRPSPEMAIHEMERSKGHLGIVTPAISEEHVVIMNTICSVILSMLVCEKYNSCLVLDYFLVTGRKIESPYFEMLVQLTSTISKSPDPLYNRLEKKAFYYMAKFLQKNQNKLLSHRNWQALKRAMQGPLEDYIASDLSAKYVHPIVLQNMRNMISIECAEDKWTEVEIPGGGWKTAFVQKRCFLFYCMTLANTKSSNESVLKSVSLNAVRTLFLQNIAQEEGDASQSYILVVDSRHAPDPEKFYIGMLLREFYESSSYTSYQTRRDYNVMMAQAPQHFRMPTNEPDLLGINGSFFFSVINVMRGLTGKVTSSGAHSIWVVARYWNGEIEPTDPFPEKPFSLTEDLHGTLKLWPDWWKLESEWCRPRVHHSIGSSRYVPVIVSNATPKSFRDFLKAYCRWGIGAVQLCPKYSLFSYIPFLLFVGCGTAVGMIAPAFFNLLNNEPWVNLLFTVAPLTIFCVIYIYFSYASETFQAKCVQWVSTSNWLFSLASGIFWVTALPFFFAFGLVLPFAPIFFAVFALLKSFMELFSYEIVKSVVNKLTKNCGLKDDNEYMRNFLVFTAMWPLNLYSVAHALTYPEEWTPNPIPFLTKIFVGQSVAQLAVIAISIWTIVVSPPGFNSAIISLILAIAYLFFMGPYFFFFYYLNSTKSTFGLFETKTDNSGFFFTLYSSYTKVLLLVPFTWMMFIFSVVVFIYVLASTNFADLNALHPVLY